MSIHIILNVIVDGDVDTGCITSLYCIYRTNLNPTILTLPYIQTPPHTITHAKPHTSLALAIVPFSAHKPITKRTLIDTLSGAFDILQSYSYTLSGNKPYKGLKLALGSSVSGYASSPSLLFRKRWGQITTCER